MSINKLDYIQDTLSYIQSKINNDNKLQHYDSNKKAEDIFMHLLNLTYGWSLQNANDEVINFPAIDLMDTTNEIVIQVTSDTNKKKVKEDTVGAFNELVKEDKYKSYAHYEIKMFYIKDKPSKSTLKNWEDEGLISQSNILGIDDINKKISVDTTHTLVTKVFRYLCNLFHDKACESDISPQLTTKLGKSTLIGREKELQEIDERLKASKILLIKGIGGVGKSTIASNYLHRHKDEYDYYGFFEGLESFESQLELAFKLEIEHGQDRLDRVLCELIKLDGNKLLVIDDVKEIKENQEKLEKILGLEHNGYRILLTSREDIEGIEQYDLDVLSIDDSKELFNSIYKVEDEVLLKEILKYLDFHALFIEMTAKTLNIKKRTLSLNKLISQFRNRDFTKIKRDDIKSYHKFLDNFSINDIVLNNEENLLFIKKISILPSIEISFEKLYEVLGCDDEDKLEDFLIVLVRNGWLIEFEDGYKLHQILQDYIVDKYPPSFEEIEVVVDGITALMGDTDNIQEAVNNRKNIIYFDSLEVFLEKVEVETEQVGTFLNNFGNIYQQLGFYQKAESLYQKALDIEEKVLNENHPNIGTSYNNLASLYYLKGEYSKVEPLLLKALKIRERMFEVYPLDVAQSYNNLAKCYSSMKEYEKAKQLYFKASEIWKKILGEEYLTITIFYNNLAELYQLMGEYQKSESLYLKVLKRREKLLEEEHPDIATTYNNLAGLYLSIGEYQKAEPLLLKALKGDKKVLEEEHPSIAITYNNLAVSSYGQGDFQKAYNYMKRSVEVLSKFFPNGHPNLTGSIKGLDMIEKKLNI